MALSLVWMQRVLNRQWHFSKQVYKTAKNPKNSSRGDKRKIVTKHQLRSSSLFLNKGHLGHSRHISGIAVKTQDVWRTYHIVPTMCNELTTYNQINIKI